MSIKNVAWIRGLICALTLLSGCTIFTENNTQTCAEGDTRPFNSVLTVPDTLRNTGMIEHYFDSLSKAQKFNGVALFAKNDSIYTFHFGKRRFDQGDCIRVDDQFQLASLSKPLSAFGLLILVNDGKLSLDDYVTSHLPDFPYTEVTLRHLLTHTSGLGNYMYVTDSIWNNPDSLMSNRDFYEIIRNQKLPIYYPVNKRFDYCNTNYALLPSIIEQVSGKPFDMFMQQRLFEPLNMNNSDYKVGSVDCVVCGHYPNGDVKRPFYLDGILGDKGLFSTVSDLYKFYREIKNPTLVHDSITLAAMQPAVRSGVDQFYGLGWRIKPLEKQGDTLVFHNGWWRGFRSYFWMSNKEDRVVIILTNSIRGGYLSQDEIWNLF